MTTYLVQLSDPHIRDANAAGQDIIDTAACLRTAVTLIGSLPQRPHAVVITGDLVDRGSDAEYECLAQLLQPLSMPVYLLPGNHDDRQALRRCFPAHTYLSQTVNEGFIQYEVPIGRLQLLALDTTVPGEAYGALCERRLKWLEDRLERLSQEGRPVVIAMHHPPFDTFIAHMDKMKLLQGAAELEALVARYPNVERVICGHVHRAIEKRFGGTFVQVAPSTAHQIALDFAPDTRARWTLEPPGFRVFVMGEEGGLVSHLLPNGQYAGPYAFGS